MKSLINKKSNNKEPETVFSKTVLTGKRIYYLDVKQNNKGKLFIIITESKKVLTKDSAQPTVHFEKHKIFLFKEDFDKFLNAMNETIAYAKDNEATDFVLPEDEDTEDFNDPINLQFDF